MKLRHGACLVVAAAVLFVASSAQMEAQTLKRLPSRGRTLGDMVRRLPKPDRNVRQKVINLDSASNNFIFAAAGSVQGAGGTFFRSDVTITNHRNAPQLIGVAFMVQGVDNSNAPIIEFQLPENAPVVARDFVGDPDGLDATGLGSIVIFGELSNGDLDTNAVLDGNSRIWTPQPGSSGTVSQGFPSVAFQDSFGQGWAYAQGLRHDGGFRTNAGIVNLDPVAHTWTVDVNGTGGRTSFTMTIPALSMRQQVIPNGNWSDVVLGFQTNETIDWWSAYAATVDNITGDSWSAHAAQP
jgi:hypothetical protein